MDNLIERLQMEQRLHDDVGQVTVNLYELRQMISSNTHYVAALDEDTARGRGKSRGRG